MRRLLILLLLLAGCDSRSENEAELPPEGQLPVAPAGADPAALSPEQQAAGAQQKAEQALAVILVDPKSARYSDVRPGAAGSVCGRVDSKQADGKYAGARPFVVTPEGVAVISATPQVMFDDPEDMFPDFYIRWCASPEELRTIGPRIDTSKLPPPPPAEDLAATLENALAPPPPPETVPPVEPVRSPPPPAPAQPAGEEDSFSRVVIRNGSGEAR